VATVTGTNIRLELQKWGIILLTGAPSATGAVGYLTDTEMLQADTIAPTIFDGAYVRINTAGGVAAGEIVRVDYVDGVNGRLNVTPDWSSAPTTSARYEIFRPGVDPDDADRARDNALTDVCSQWYLHPVSEVTNAAYVEALSSSNWEAINNAAIAKQVLGFPMEFARDSILVTNSGANGGAESFSIYTQPGKSFYLWVPVSGRTGTAEVVVRDITNSADITLNGTSTLTGRGWSAIEVTGQIPSGCYEITIRLQAQGASDIAEYGPICFHWQEQRRISLPARVVSREWVGPVQRLTNQAIADDNWAQEDINEVLGVRVEQVSDNVQLRFNEPLSTQPHFYLERAYYSALSATYITDAARATGDAATTLCPTDYVVPAMTKLLAEQYRIKHSWDSEFWDGVLQQATRELAIKEKLYGPKTKARIERARGISIPNLRI